MSETASGIAGRASELASGTQERAGEIGWQARRQTERVKTNLEHVAEENPLTIAIGATILGMALGLLLPGTERENELMGPARDQLVDRAERTAERVKDAAVEAGREVKDAVQTEITERTRGQAGGAGSRHDGEGAGEGVGQEGEERKQDATNRAESATGTATDRRANNPARDGTKETMSLDSLEKLFLEELKDIYNAEKQLTRALPRMAKAAESPELRQAFTSHLKETEGQIQRLERVFQELGQAARGKKCKGDGRVDRRGQGNDGGGGRAPGAGCGPDWLQPRRWSTTRSPRMAVFAPMPSSSATPRPRSCCGRTSGRGSGRQEAEPLAEGGINERRQWPAQDRTKRTNSERCSLQTKKPGSAPGLLVLCRFKLPRLAASFVSGLFVLLGRVLPPRS